MRGGCFTPLHCGAVVASVASAAATTSATEFQSPSLRGSGRFILPAPAPAPALARVSIPFIAGQWSLPLVKRLRHVLENEFQSPSLRGSGRFSITSPSSAEADEFQSPSLRGSGRFGGRPDRPAGRPARFNPLHCGAVVASRNRAQEEQLVAECFNPLHCGAVVASAEHRAARLGADLSFNPLHCGAVVASARREAASRNDDFHVSIPFIAGQWSLLADLNAAADEAARVSIPFIAGQWSLPDEPTIVRALTRALFQSPSLRGSGRFERRARDASRRAGFQSPSLRGSGRFQKAIPAMDPERAKFQSPSLRGSGRFSKALIQGGQHGARFNPLHCGAVVASAKGSRPSVQPDEVSIPFIAGQWSLRGGPGGATSWIRTVSIPFIAGQWSLLPRTTPLSFCGVRLRKRRLPCDHVLCARLHVWPKPGILP